MNFRAALRIATLLTLVVLSGEALPAELRVGKPVMAHLATLPRGEALQLDGFPTGPSSNASIRFERVEIYAPGAHVYIATANGEQEIPRSNRIFLRGYSADGTARVALSLNPDASFAEGNGSGPEGSFVLQARVAAGAHTFVARLLDSTLPPGFKFDFRCGNELETMDAPPDSLAKQLQAATTAASPAVVTASSHALRLATVAVDTDSLFMSRLFSNNTTNAKNWIASMFNTMNAMYERDLLVELYQGTTILCAGGCIDPYTAFTPGASSTELNFFANYWMVNHASVSRAFAVLLSGQIASTPTSCGGSGIAWVDQYCQKGFISGTNTVGSYSVNQVCTSINIDPNGSFNARLVGHELGHNFGAAHTHCTDKTTGVYKVSTNTIDQCYNTESTCYAGTASCPAGGAGTIMSYCNIQGCASGSQVLLQFHPTQVTALDSLISGQAACLNETDDIFYDGFQ